VLHNLASQYGDQVAVISIYTSGGSPPFYNSTAYQKIYTYPPPYWYNGTWYFATPWLWVDGNKSAAYLTSTWNTHISQRLQVPSDLEINISGDGSGGVNSVNLQVEINNTGLSAITGNLHCVLTENDIQWAAPNGQQVHNHVPRIWWPNQNGMELTIPSGDGTTVPVSWSFQPSWDVDKLWVVAYLQSTTMQPDSTIEIFQGASVKLTDMPTGIAEQEDQRVSDFHLFQNYPNPFNPTTTISYRLPANDNVELTIYDQLGRQIRKLVNEKQTTGFHQTEWNGLDDNGKEVSSGIYFYQLKANGSIESRKMFLIR
jgi:hypothetical protein